jgi:hypothetical protein
MRDDLLDKTLEVISRFDEEGVEYAVIGGVALNFHGLIRATEDLDVFVRPLVSNIASLRRALRRVWDDPEIEQITAEDLFGDYPAVRYGPPDDSLPLDILTRLGELVHYDDLVCEQIEIEGVLGPGHGRDSFDAVQDEGWNRPSPRSGGRAGFAADF